MYCKCKVTKVQNLLEIPVYSIYSYIHTLKFMYMYMYVYITDKCAMYSTVRVRYLYTRINFTIQLYKSGVRVICTLFMYKYSVHCILYDTVKKTILHLKIAHVFIDFT